MTVHPKSSRHDPAERTAESVLDHFTVHDYPKILRRMADDLMKIKAGDRQLEDEARKLREVADRVEGR